MSGETPAGGSAPRWTLPDAAIVLAGGFLLSALGSAVAAAAVHYHSSGGANEPVAVIVASLVGLWIGFAGGTIYLSRARGSGHLGDDVGLRFGGWRDVVGGAAVGLASQYGLIWVLYEPFVLLDPSLRHRLDAPARQSTGAAHGPVQIALVVVFLCVGAPLVEELFFRGLLLRTLLGRFAPWISVLASSVVFGLVHFEALQLAGLIAFGVVLGTLAWRTGRLGPGIAAHAAFNAAAVATSLAARH